MLVAQRQSASIHEFDILWITAGLGCDGDTIAMTAAAQPSLEDLLSGALPWLPKIHLHDPFLSFDNGEELWRIFTLPLTVSPRENSSWLWKAHPKRKE
jgi:hydrogenase small subunit